MWIHSEMRTRHEKNIQSIILYLKECFGELTGYGQNFNIDTRVVDGGKILHNICTKLGIHNWVLPERIPVNSDNQAFSGEACDCTCMRPHTCKSV